MILTTLVATVALSAPSIDVYVDGGGMMRFVREGRTVFAKTATLVARDGLLRHSEGPAVLPSIAVPAGVLALDMDLQGNVYSIRNGASAKLGRLTLGMFADERRLIGDGDFWLSAERATIGNPGEEN